MAEGGKKKTHASSKAELMVKTMVMKKLQKEGSMGDVAITKSPQNMRNCFLG